ncbi:M14 family metallopeptidase [Aneurinibacillus terranovensis]|uniref:M14 family metallopeptidase n=1 Tax=Aneurinibacillus terranovensis TaxID=278991 RepID=UPI0003F79E06|nr:M14 family metallocarboxypeptidase [Aneurinibacillus terranovensis]
MISCIVQSHCAYGYNVLEQNLSALSQAYPFLYMERIGCTVEGRNLYAIRLGKGKKEIFYSGAWHANEWLTTTVLMKFIEDFAAYYARGMSLQGYHLPSIYEAFSIWIVPMVNPDGVELVVNGVNKQNPFFQEVLAINGGSCEFQLWTANIRGVDLNHQWPALWEEEAKTSPQQPAPRHYGGIAPLCEPEARAIHRFTLTHDFLAVLAYHSQGEEIFWGYQNMEPPGSEAIVRRMQELSTYTPIHTADSTAGYKDWFIQEYRRPGFTIEIGRGSNPLPVEHFDNIYQKNIQLLLETPLLL